MRELFFLPQRYLIHFILFALIISAQVNYAQVKIKEKVDIEPGLLTFGPSEEGATLRIELSGGPNASVVIVITGTTYTTSVAEKQNTSGYYEFAINFRDERGVEAYGSYSLNIYYNDYLIQSQSGGAYSFFGYGWTTCSFPGYTFFRSADVNTTNNCGLGFYFDININKDNNICSGGNQWQTPPEVTVTLNAANAEFYDRQTGTMIGNSFTSDFQTANSHRYIIVSKLAYYSDPVEGTITVTMGSISATGDITIYPQGKFTLYRQTDCSPYIYPSIQRNCNSAGEEDNPVDQKLSIIKGGQFVSFYNDNTKELVGDELNTLSANLWEYVIQVDQTESPNEDEEVIVQYEAMGFVQADTFYIHPAGPAHIDAFAWNTEIEHNEKTYIFLTHYNEICDYPFPDSTKFKLTITEGAEFGEFTGLQNLGLGTTCEIPVENGCCAIVNYEANGAEPDSIETVVIMVESSVPGIEPVFVTLKIYPADIKVSLIPPFISPGDTADIHIDLWNPQNESYEPLLPGTPFEIGVLGCQYGNILSSAGELNTFFPETMEPVRFVADADPDIDSIKVNIGVMLGIWAGKAVKKDANGKKDKEFYSNSLFIQQKQSEIKAHLDELNVPTSLKETIFKKYNSINLTSPASPQTCIPDFNAEYYSLGKIVIKRKCSDLQGCSGLLYPEFVEYKLVPSGGKYPNVCFLKNVIELQSGAFLSLEWHWNYSQEIDAEPCFNIVDSKVFFKMLLRDIPTQVFTNVLRPEAILEVCENCINAYHKILIKTPDQLLNIMRNNPSEIPTIKADIKNILTSYGANIIKYYFESEILAHESEHKKDYEHFLISLKKEFLDDKILLNKINCEEFRNDENVIHLSKVNYLIFVQRYIEEVNKAGSKYTNDYIIQMTPNVQNSLNIYIKLISDFEKGFIH